MCEITVKIKQCISITTFIHIKRALKMFIKMITRMRISIKNINILLLRKSIHILSQN